MGDNWNIKDNEIRVIGGRMPSSEKKERSLVVRIVFWVLGILAFLLILLVAVLSHNRDVEEPDEPGVFESAINDTVPDLVVLPDKPFLGNYVDNQGISYTEEIKKTINGIPLSIYIPHGAIPELCLKAPDFRDTTIVLAAQAADIRKDNYMIVGAFVLKGKVLARGLSKKGYCFFSDNRIEVGVSGDSPLFQKAIDEEGYFFRQYALVDNGEIVEVNMQAKSFRKALCDRAGEIFIAKTDDKETFHDFSQALVDLEVDNAIYLVGSNSYGFWQDVEGVVTEFSDKRESKYEYESYILWRKL